MIEKPLIYFCVSTALGCVCALLLRYNVILDALICASFLLCLFLNIEKHYFILIIMFFIIGFASFQLYFDLSLNSNYAYKIRVITKNKYYSVGSYKGRKLNLQGALFSIKEGENITVTGKFEKQNDYEEGSIGNFKITEVEKVQDDILYSLYSFREKIYRRFYWQIGENNADKLMAVSYGDASHLSLEDKNDFKRLGIIHAVSVSGLHLLVLYKFITFFLDLKLSLGVCTLYTVFTGCQPPTVRALIMLIIFQLSKKFNKNYDFFSSISLAALVLLIFKPYYIVDLGFMLSFLSTLGIGVFYKKLSRLFFRLPKIINESLSASLSAQILSMPYTLFTIKNFCLGFLLGNFIIVPVFSAIVVLGNIALLALPIKFLFNFIAYLITVLLEITKLMTIVLLKVSPPLVYVSPLNALIVLTLYVCYIFVKSGYSRAKYVPLLLIFFVFIQYYSFFPQLNFVKLRNGEGYIIRNKFKSILISNYEFTDQEEKTEAAAKLNVNEFLCYKDKTFNIILDKKYCINIDEEGAKISDIKNDKNILMWKYKTVQYKGLCRGTGYDIINFSNIKNYKNTDLPKQYMDFNIIMDKIAAVKE